jgi:hypothetical protein
MFIDIFYLFLAELIDYSAYFYCNVNAKSYLSEGYEMYRVMKNFIE